VNLSGSGSLKKQRDSAIYNLILVAITGLLFHSCAPVTELPIEILQPARVTFPDNAEKIQFINRSYYLRNDTVLGYKKTITEEEFNILDTALNNHFFKGLIEGMNSSPLFDLGYPEVLNERRYDTSNFLAPLSFGQLNRYRENNGCDLLISLDYYHVQDTTELKLDYETFWYEATEQVITLTAWRVYDVNALSLLDEYIQMDTVYWFVTQDNLDDLARELPPLLHTFREAAYRNGSQYSLRISPGWYDTERYIYHSGSKELRKAGKKALAGNWEEAAVEWERLTDTIYKPKIRAKAYTNLAVNAEISDDISRALEYANRSYSLKSENYILEYINILLLRELNQEMLLKQLPPESDPIRDALKGIR